MKNRRLLIALTGITGVLSALALYGGSKLVEGDAQALEYSLIRGLSPHSTITYQIAYEPDYNGLKAGPDSKTLVESSASVDANGIAQLPAMKPYYKSMTVRSMDAEKPLNLKISNFGKTGRFQISGEGFSPFSEVLVEKQGRSNTLKTDWAGLFENTMPSHFDKSPEEGLIKLAFSGFSMNDAPSNPAMLEVVITQGGGPTDADVNDYNPRIHEYNCGAPASSIDGVSVFRPSTCDSGPMSSTINRIPGNIVAPMMLMAEQLSAVMMQQMQIIGSFLDAKEQIEAQRDFQQLTAQAHKDYHPSEQMCQFGSYVRSISQTQLAAEHNKMAVNKVLSNYMNQTDNAVTAEGASMDVNSRLEKFKQVYCDPNQLGGALWEVCRNTTFDAGGMPDSGTDDERNRFNKDIDYFMTFDRPLTMEIDFNNSEATESEEDVLALAKNLYWPVSHDYPSKEAFEAGFDDNYHLYLATRNILSKYNIAQNSFASIVGMKSSMPDTLDVASGPAFMKAFMRDYVELAEEDIHAMMGDDPSYYAQMEFLTKKLYQHPTFYTSLYDKPANVDRLNVTMEAIQLMQGRDQFESMLRQEMLVSMLVEQEIMKEANNINGILYALGNQAKRTNPAGFP